MIDRDVLQVDVPLHDWGCEENHGNRPVHTVTWPDGRRDRLPTCCYERGILIDAQLDPFERIEWLPGLTVTDDSFDATMTLHKIGDDLYLLVFGRTDERDGGVEPFPMYETVSITAIRGSREAALRAWDARVKQWTAEQEFDELDDQEVAFLRWTVAHLLDDEGAVTYRHYLAENSSLDESDLVDMIRDLELCGFLIPFDVGLDGKPSPTTKADVLVESLQAGDRPNE